VESSRPKPDLLPYLDRRAGANDAAMWVAPVVMLAAQAFLLQVLADDSIDWWARLFVLAGGAIATPAAIFTLVRGHTREVQYSEAVEFNLDRPGALRPWNLDEVPAPDSDDEPRAVTFDRWVREGVKTRGWLHAAYWWSAALLFLMVADLLVFLARL
jgi:hypothetical protein